MRKLIDAVCWSREELSIALKIVVCVYGFLFGALFALMFLIA